MADFEHRTADSVANAAARLGFGQQNLLSQTSYAYNTVTRNRQNLDNAYRGSWLVGVAVDSMADDMTRAGIEYTGSMPPIDQERLRAEWSRLLIWKQLGHTIRWARLYGGCIAVILIDGQSVDTPLKVDTIGKGQFQGLLVLDRWMVQPTLNEIETDFGPFLGQPKFYQVNATPQSPTGSTGDTTTRKQPTGQRIHYSRIIRLDGMPLPFFARQTENGWGQSILERLYDRLIAYDSATIGMAQLVYKAHLRVVKFEGFREAVALGGQPLEGVKAHLDFIRQFQTNEGITGLDIKDEYQPHSYGFDGLPAVLASIEAQLCGALQTPAVRLFGQSPAGFSTGDTDLESWGGTVNMRQESDLRPGVHLLLDISSRSALGKPLPDDFGFKFTPLTEMSAAEKADVASKLTDSVVKAVAEGIIGPQVALQELKQGSFQTGVFSNIQEADIAAADRDPPAPVIEEGGPNMPGDDQDIPSNRPAAKPPINHAAASGT